MLIDGESLETRLRYSCQATIFDEGEGRPEAYQVLVNYYNSKPVTMETVTKHFNWYMHLPLLRWNTEC